MTGSLVIVNIFVGGSLVGLLLGSMVHWLICLFLKWFTVIPCMTPDWFAQPLKVPCKAHLLFRIFLK